MKLHMAALIGAAGLLFAAAASRSPAAAGAESRGRILWSYETGG